MMNPSRPVLDSPTPPLLRGMVLIGLCLMLIVTPKISWSSEHAITQPEYQTPASIIAAVRAFLQQRYPTTGAPISFQVNRLDPRLKLKQCDQSLSVHNNQQSVPRGGRVTVLVACEGANPWRIYVPAQIQRMVTVLSLARPLATGERVTAQDLAPLVVNANQQARAYLTDATEAIGQVLARPMQAGQILTRQDLNIAQLIHRGDHVTIVAGTGGITVSAEGIAQDSAGQGQRLLVKNSRTGAQIEGIVRDANTVVVP